jgi:hypothetical protein
MSFAPDEGRFTTGDFRDNARHRAPLASGQPLGPLVSYVTNDGTGTSYEMLSPGIGAEGEPTFHRPTTQLPPRRRVGNAMRAYPMQLDEGEEAEVTAGPVAMRDWSPAMVQEDGRWRSLRRVRHPFTLRPPQLPVYTSIAKER